MPRLQAFLECVGQTLCEKGRKALQGQWSFSDILPEIVRSTYDYAARKLPGPDLRQALGDCAACDVREYERRIGELIAELSQTHAVPKAELSDYMRALPACVRQAFRRPSDPFGRTAPDKLAFFKPDEIAIFLPPRIPRFRPGDKLEDWTLTELHGLGQCSETWRAEDPKQPDHSPAALKFVTDKDLREPIKNATALFTKVFDLNAVPGILPLQSVYLETDPPCFESPFVHGYDLAGLLLEWKCRYESAKPEAALKLMRRLASIVAQAHEWGVVHRDLKPTAVLLHPTDGGKFTLWIANYGWGQIESSRCLELSRSGSRSDQLRLIARGAGTPLYACPQQAKKEPAHPTDDIHALGVIWYQLLRRDRTEAAPVGTDWIEELRPAGFTDSQARVLQSCLSTRPDKRPKNGAALVEQLSQVTMGPAEGPDGSKLIMLRNPGSAIYSPAATATARGKSFDAEAAAASAAALLSAAGGGPLAGGGPGTTSSTAVRLVKNSIGMTFVRIAAGSFRMGSPDSEPGHRPHESPLHEVKITKPFYISVVPVTQAQYDAVKGKNPSKFSRGHGGGADHPVENVAWSQAVRFCEKLSKMTDEEIHHRIYRLPTEAEWEFVCRAGTITPFCGGDKLLPASAAFAGGSSRYSGKSTSPVAQSMGNSWGVHDMHGNVQEWVQDWFEEYYYFESPNEDPQGPKKGTLKVVRGGCWGMMASDCRSAARRGHAPESPSETIGFRVVMVV